ncbi:MAG: LacI family transcriptional regulator [Geminicoccaceae bacterium]|nr:LacI family transcriptional regulator [Geminicoccaceae bacterium]MCS7268042.1 LacI family transcriptional regulator [Geminicoccaceae bacterium]MCX7629815.1 LacI family transcriptional regulator [Geminicoccaceae bacterium]MDW8124753.1 LacI family DNA-binding transcriptional regulator [Geminicoccaceae bacterium]MDW8341420.1 LacI family DNA-binding transcriptional regulator [Geminicoccaceae bacterium]
MLAYRARRRPFMIPAVPRRATIKDVARMAGTSTVTVSRVVNSPHLVQAETRARVEAAMRALGYVPNLAARAMRTRLTRSIGFLTPELTSLPNAAVAEATARALFEAGYGMLLVSSDYRVERELRAIELLRQRQVDGLMLYVSDDRDEELRAAVAALDVPLVVLDRDLPLGDRVLSDHRSALELALRRLLAMGHRRFALVQPDVPIRPVRERLAATEATLAAAGLPKETLVRIAVPPAALDRAALPSELFTGSDRPTAFLVEGGRLLRAALLAFRGAGLEVPRDVSLVAIDAEETAALLVPETTRVVRDFAAIGRTAATLLLNRLEKAHAPRREVVLESRLLLGASCAPPARPA